MHPSRAVSRVAESIDEVDRFATELDAWFASAPGLLGRHGTQLSTLSEVLRPALLRNREHLAGLDTGRDAGEVYDACRRADRRTVFVRRLWQWFATRFDQRRDPRTRDVLQAADEVVWSCWAPAWQLTGAGRPGPAPLPYLDPQISASTTPRQDVPHDLAAVRDSELAAQVRAMPVPVIALPERVAWRPWWLVLLAHETGHHVQFELTPDAGAAAGDVVADAAARAGAGDDEVLGWQRWSAEMFADAYAAVLTGPAITWAVGELELRAGDGVLRSPAPGYPPPLVRLALLAAITGEPAVVGDPASTGDPGGAGRGPAGSGPLAARVTGLLERVPAVAAALLTVPVGSATLAVAAPQAVAWRQAAAVWRRQLTATAEPRPSATVDAARLCVAGAVAAWRDTSAGIAADRHGSGATAGTRGTGARTSTRTAAGTGAGGASDGDRLSRRLLTVLPACGPSGLRSTTAAPAAAVRRAARSVSDALFSAAVEEEP
ncbi:hypothetical protein AB0F72_32505 [Actinoplanes sp. NPDC023936]|uniref:hypothetical protein n=1 Tax=Actinoplanes sp. NPDC023936 TaxID=3154910 RepID=UPI003407E983